jgi:hypothetical protein
MCSPRLYTIFSGDGWPSHSGCVQHVWIKLFTTTPKNFSNLWLNHVVDGLNLIEGVVLRCTHAQLLAVSLQQFSSGPSWNQNYISPLFSPQMQGAVFRDRERVGPRFLARSTLSLSLSQVLFKECAALLESPSYSRNNKRGLNTTNKPQKHPGQQLRPVFILSQKRNNNHVQKGSLQWTIWVWFTPKFFKSPQTTNCTGLLHLTLTNTSYSWALRSDANLIAL